MPSCQTKNFDIVILGGQSPYPVMARYAEQTGEGQFDHDALQPDWAETIRILGQTDIPPTEPFILQVGGLLFDELIRGSIRDLWIEARTNLGRREHLRVRLDLRSPAVAALPWETLADPRRRRTLAADKSLALVRTATDVEFVGSARPIQTRLPAKLLIAIAEEPDNIDAAKEVSRIETALAPLIPHHIQIEILTGRFDIQGLRRRLQQSRPDILHIISHGETDGLYFWENDELVLVRASQLAATLDQSESVKLVFLNACLAGQPDDATPFASLAQRLLQTGIPAVIAMQYVVPDRAAADFAGFLYEALVSGPCPGAIDIAMSIARSGLYISDPDRIDYAIPLLWLNGENGQILGLDEEAAQPVEPSQTPGGLPSDVIPPPPQLAREIEEKEAWCAGLPDSIESPLRFDYAERKKQAERALALLRLEYAGQQAGKPADFRRVSERLDIFHTARRDIDNLLKRLLPSDR
ncbi:MAG: CHAT domain-containing protein [Caldilineaceae bacterium]